MPFWLSLVIKLLLLCHVLNANQSFDCKQCENPNYGDSNFRPQDCARYCKHLASSPQRNKQREEMDVGVLLQQMKNVSIMITVLLVLVILMMLLVLCFVARNSALSNAILKSWKSCRKNQTTEDKERKDTKHELNRVTVHKEPHTVTALAKPEKQKVVFSHEKKSRKPAESITPDDSEAVEIDGYDNLGMSRSTINTHSRCSSPSSPTSNNGVTSCATIDTAMTTINLDS